MIYNLVSSPTCDIAWVVSEMTGTIWCGGDHLVTELQHSAVMLTGRNDERIEGSTIVLDLRESDLADKTSLNELSSAAVGMVKRRRKDKPVNANASLLALHAAYALAGRKPSKFWFLLAWPRPAGARRAGISPLGLPDWRC